MAGMREPGHGSRSEVEGRLRPHVQHALDVLFHPGELEEWRFVWDHDLEEGRRNVAVVLVACGEQHYGFVWQEYADHPPEAGLDVLVDGVEDFISESRFAWGQRRELEDRPWNR